MTWPCAQHARPRCAKHGTLLKKNEDGELVCWFAGGHIAEVLVPPCFSDTDSCRRATPCAEKKRMGDEADPYALSETCAQIRERFN